MQQGLFDARPADGPPAQRGGSERTSVTLPGVEDSGKVGSKALRRTLYQLQDSYRLYSAKPRVSKCGHTRCSSDVAVQAGPDGASYAGLIRCRAKACPVCLAKRRSRYADEINAVAEAWARRQGHRVTYMATFTIRHGMDAPLALTGHGVREAWGACVGSLKWQTMRRKYGLEYIVAEEVTFGGHGWHPHLHVLFLPERPLTEQAFVEVQDFLAQRWELVVQRTLGARFVPDFDHGSDFRPAKREEYISKHIGLELADPGTKEGRRKGRTPIQLLDSWMRNWDELALERYQEYERAMSGRRDLTWSRRLRALRVAACRALDELASERGQQQAVAAVLPGRVWDQWRHHPGARHRLLEAAERGGGVQIEALIAAELGHEAVQATRARTAIYHAGDASVSDLSELAVAREARAPP